MSLAPFDLNELSRWGEGLIRPEDVAVGRDGRVYATDPHVGACEILPDGSLRSVGETVFPGCCNGISMDLDNRILLANLGAHEGVAGPLERLDPNNGLREVLLSEVDGRKLTSCNYPMIDRAGNIWCTNSIAAENFEGLAEKRTHDGFIFVLRPDGTSSIVADGIGFANGLAMSADETYLFCCQTFGSNILRYPMLPGGQLGPGEQYGPLLGPKGEPSVGATERASLHYPDGCAFDVDGNLWIALFWENKIVAITPEGELVTLIDDPERKMLKSPANVTFGGEDMKDVYIGGLEMNYVVKLHSPVAGMKLAHQV